MIVKNTNANSTSVTACIASGGLHTNIAKQCHGTRTISRLTLATSIMLVLAGCATTQQEHKYEVAKSFLATQEQDSGPLNSIPETDEPTSQSLPSYQTLQTLQKQDQSHATNQSLAEQFDANQRIAAVAKSMPVTDFIQYSFGQVLGANYVIDQELTSKDQQVTLNVANDVTQQDFYRIVSQLLDESNISITFKNNTFFLHTKEANSRGKSAPVVIGIGEREQDVPETTSDIVQVVQLKYGIKLSIQQTLSQLVDAKITADHEQSALFIRGKRDSILRALDIIRMLDAPSNRGKYIGLMRLTYLNTEEFGEQIANLLENEGLPVSIGNHANKNIVLVPLPNIDSMVVFSSRKEGLDRVRYWARQIDRPSMAETKQYFIYHPRFARASDIGESLSPLISARSGGSVTSSTRKSSASASANTESTGQVPTTRKNVGSSSEDMSFVVDERSNAIIFYTTGKEYQSVRPMIERLDVLPKQVLLDVVIAEVTLTDEFSLGVDFALKSGSVPMPKDFLLDGGLFTSGKSGGALSIGGSNGALIATALQTNQHVNVLSNPSVLVRDGVKADLSVGTQISVIGSTVSDDLGGSDLTETKVEYRNTGVEISVTPTVNAQGIVIMEISEKISNEVNGATGASGNPNIFERTLNTEVVAKSGQTIILAGLVSNNTSDNSSGIPFLKDLPAVGSLFSHTSTSNNKTELVMLITPQIIHSTDQWESITQSFQQGMDNLRF